MPSGDHQPYLHDSVTLVRAPVLCLSAASGRFVSDADGCYIGDRRVLSRLDVRVDDAEASPIGTTSQRPDETRFLAVLRDRGDDGPDPTVLLERTRRVDPGGLSETVTVTSFARSEVTGTLWVRAAGDGADMAVVKSGRTGPLLPPRVGAAGWSWPAVSLTGDRPADVVEDDELGWFFSLSRGQRFEVQLRLTATAADPVGQSADGALGARRISVVGHASLDAFLARSVADLDALTLADVRDPTDHFLAAGAPWYLTLFGRDSIWAARMLLAGGTDLAHGTLRVLARRQGRVTDPGTAEEPGKILHEVRTVSAEHGSRTQLPPVYYGTVDATPLWLLLLHDAWRWGLRPDRVRALMPNAEAAIGWVRDTAERNGGFVAYRDESGSGLTNQGWKDSSDGVQFRDGRLASPPIALCEVQGYAHAAALAFADLQESLGRDGDDWRQWAAELAARFRDAFWADDERGRYPAIALDGRGRAVDGLTSNIGHLLGTGLLNADEEQLVAARLAGPDLDSGFGLRTLSSRSAGFNPLSYHAGSVWTHDTAIAVLGLSGVRSPEATRTAHHLTQGLIDAAAAFDGRIPELHAGYNRQELSVPAPYPAACRPQAWSAASAIAILVAALGLDPDAPHRTLRVRPWSPWPLGPLTVTGIRLGGLEMVVRVDATGDVEVTGLPDGWGIEVG